MCEPETNKLIALNLFHVAQCSGMSYIDVNLEPELDFILPPWWYLNPEYTKQSKWFRTLFTRKLFKYLFFVLLLLSHSQLNSLFTFTYELVTDKVQSCLISNLPPPRESLLNWPEWYQVWASSLWPREPQLLLPHQRSVPRWYDEIWRDTRVSKIWTKYKTFLRFLKFAQYEYLKQTANEKCQHR